MWENVILWPFVLIVSNLGFILAFLFIVYLFKSNKSPSTTFAWLFFVLSMPYLGVPLYLFFGGRKMKKMTAKKDFLWKDKQVRTTGEEPSLPGGLGALFGVHDEVRLQAQLSGNEAFEALTMHIKNAKNHICIATFILGNDATGNEVVRLLTEKLKQGVSVYLLLDAIGSSPFFSKPPDLTLFKKHGGKVAYFMPMIRLPFRGRANLRNHRKIILVDHQVAMLGGMNIASHYMGAGEYPDRWRDLIVTLKGDVIEDLYHVFESDWEFAAGSKLPLEKIPMSVHEKGESPAEHIAKVQLVPSGPDVEGDPLHESLLALIFEADKKVSIVTPYFVPDELLMKALCIAARRGVKVELIVPDHSNHPITDLARGYFLRHLENQGVKIYRYLPGMVHGKLILIDNDISLIGSANMDMRSLFLNYEIALFIRSESKQRVFEGWMRDLIKDSEAGVKPATFLRELIESATRLLSPLL